VRRWPLWTVSGPQVSSSLARHEHGPTIGPATGVRNGPGRAELDLADPRYGDGSGTYHGDMAGSPGSARPGRASHNSGHRSAAFFDLDKTIIAKSSSLAFSKPFQAGGLITRGAMLRSAYAQFVYLVGGADHDQMEKIRAFMSQLVEGWDVETVKEIVGDTLHHIVDPIVYDEAVSLMEEHHVAGRDVVVVSASGTEVVEPIGEMLGADEVIASQLEIVDGKYTGEIDYYAYANEKARAIETMAVERGYDLEQCFAYSDSITDAPMLEVVGHPHAVNPDKELRKLAASRGWPVLQFSRPVTLRSRIPVKPTLAALTVGTALTLGGAIWLNRRRKLGA
jgi:HAD superfamily hydrolase (TIGR01490 family)